MYLFQIIEEQLVEHGEMTFNRVCLHACVELLTGGVDVGREHGRVL